MIGGAGNDIYLVDSTTDRIYETWGKGTDSIRSTVSMSLLWNGGQIENLYLLGADDRSATGNDLDNILSGNDGHNILNAVDPWGANDRDTVLGGGGDDRILVAAGDGLFDGGAGRDRIVFNQLAAMTLDLRLTGVQDSLGAKIIRGIEHVVANDRADRIMGNNLANQIDGRLGSDTLFGHGGSDTLYGGNEGTAPGAARNWLDGGMGNDDLIGGNGLGGFVMFAGSLNATVDLRLTVGQNTGFGIDRLLNIESLRSDARDDRLIGNARANTILSQGCAIRCSALGATTGCMAAMALTSSTAGWDATHS